MRLKELRKQKNLTQAELSQLLNIKQQYYSRYETGIAEPNIENLIKLADFYNVSIDYLVGRDWNNKAYIEVWKLSEKQKESFSLIEKLNDIECLQVQTYIKSMQETLNNPDMDTLRILKTKD